MGKFLYQLSMVIYAKNADEAKRLFAKYIEEQKPHAKLYKPGPRTHVAFSEADVIHVNTKEQYDATRFKGSAFKMPEGKQKPVECLLKGHKFQIYDPSNISFVCKGCKAIFTLEQFVFQACEKHVQECVKGGVRIEQVLVGMQYGHYTILERVKETVGRCKGCSLLTYHTVYPCITRWHKIQCEKITNK